MFLQSVPTSTWNDEDLEMLVSKAFEMKQLYHYNTRLVNGNTMATSNNLLRRWWTYNLKSIKFAALSHFEPIRSLGPLSVVQLFLVFEFALLFRYDFWFGLGILISKSESLVGLEQKWTAVVQFALVSVGIYSALQEALVGLVVVWTFALSLLLLVSTSCVHWLVLHFNVPLLKLVVDVVVFICARLCLRRAEYWVGIGGQHLVVVLVHINNNMDF